LDPSAWLKIRLDQGRTYAANVHAIVFAACLKEDALRLEASERQRCEEVLERGDIGPHEIFCGAGVHDAFLVLGWDIGIIVDIISFDPRVLADLCDLLSGGAQVGRDMLDAYVSCASVRKASIGSDSGLHETA
jgi:hypothetical protein